MDANAVALYLKENPKFFEDYADVIAEIFVPHPHGGHAIPIAERQIVTLREKNSELENRLRELIRFGGENDQIGEKLHRSTLALFAAPDLETTLAVLYHSLKEDFGVPHVACRLWGKVPEQSYLPELAATSQELRDYADQLGAPYCGPVAPFESRDWFDAGDDCRSFAFLPLRTAHTFGLLGLGERGRRALPRRHGHGVPDAPRGARERGDVALPAAGVAVARSGGPVAMRKTTPPGSAAAGRRAGQRRASRARSPTHLAARPAHTRAAYLRDARVLAALAGDRRSRGALARASCGAFSRRCTAAGCRGAASRGCFRRGARSIGFLQDRDAALKENPCAGLKAPKSARRLPSALSPDEAVRLVEIAGDDPLAVRDRALFELAYSSGLRLVRARRARCRPRRSRDRRSARLGQGREGADRAGRRRGARRRSARGCRCAPALRERGREGAVRRQERQADHAARDRAPARGLGGQAGARRGTSIRTCCGTRSRRTCCSRRATCARCRRCWATRASPARRCTRTSTSRRSPRPTTRAHPRAKRKKPAN